MKSYEPIGIYKLQIGAWICMQYLGELLKYVHGLQLAGTQNVESAEIKWNKQFHLQHKERKTEILHSSNPW